MIHLEYGARQLQLMAQPLKHLQSDSDSPHPQFRIMRKTHRWFDIQYYHWNVHRLDKRALI